jgi:hypothetical protein
VSLFPGGVDSLLPANVAGDVGIKAAIDAVQVRLVHLFGTIPNASPAAGGTVNPDLSIGSQLAVILPSGVSTVTLGPPTSSFNGDWLTIYPIQNSTGVALITWSKAAGGYRTSANLALSTIANAIDSMTFRYNSGANLWNQVSHELNIS